MSRVCRRIRGLSHRIKAQTPPNTAPAYHPNLLSLLLLNPTTDSKPRGSLPTDDLPVCVVFFASGLRSEYSSHSRSVLAGSEHKTCRSQRRIRNSLLSALILVFCRYRVYRLKPKDIFLWEIEGEKSLSGPESLEFVVMTGRIEWFISFCILWCEEVSLFFVL